MAGTSPPQTKDTPERSHRTSESRSASLQSKRDALLRELDCFIPEYDVKQFLGVLPRTNIDFDDVTEQLVDEGVILEVHDAGKFPDTKFRLAHFPTGPKTCTDTESIIFNRLNENIYKKMVSAVSKKHPTLSPTTQLKSDPNMTSEGDRTKPDAHFVLDGKVLTEKKCNWEDVSCTGEFKKADLIAHRDDNVTKMVLNLHHTMSIGPCRWFTFGFTIDSTRMRLWFLSRSVFAVSTSFDFIRDPKIFFRFFLSMTYGKNVELGWDETVTRVEGKDWCYEIQCADKRYRVLEVLADYGTDVLTGRETRVYKAQHVTKVGELGGIFVLKDVYINDDRKTDDEIYDEIMASVRDEEDRRYLKEHLLEPCAHWTVTVDGVEDQIVKVMMHYIPTGISRFFRLIAKDAEDYDPARESAAPLVPDQGTQIAALFPPKDPWKIVGRKHYRIVFIQVATPIWQLTSLSDVFLVLRDAAKTLKVLAKYSWVHRDISIGNVHYHDGKGLLGDLEYAKMFEKESTHDGALIGTLDFMAAEVIGQDYMVSSGVEDRSILNYNIEDVLNDDSQDDDTQNNGISDDVMPVFEHNFCHDAESLFWLAVFVLFFNRDVSSPEVTDWVLKEREKCIQFVFPRNVPESALRRSGIIFAPQNFKKHVQWLYKSFKVLIKPLFAYVLSLDAAYTQFEKSLREKQINDPKLLLTVHDYTVKVFDKCMQKFLNITIEPYGSRAMIDSQPHTKHQPNSQPESNAGDPKPNSPELDNQQPPARNAGHLKRKVPPDVYIIENLPRYTEKKICLGRTR